MEEVDEGDLKIRENDLLELFPSSVTWYSISGFHSISKFY